MTKQMTCLVSAYQNAMHVDSMGLGHNDALEFLHFKSLTAMRIDYLMVLASITLIWTELGEEYHHKSSNKRT